MIGDRVKALRSKKGVTQETLAKKLFISPQAVSRWEQGLAVPDTAILVPLADYFGVTVDYLLREKEKQQEVDYRDCFEINQEFHEGKYGSWITAHFKNISGYSFRRIDYVVNFLNESGDVIDYQNGLFGNSEPNTTKIVETVSCRSPNAKSATLTITKYVPR